MPPPWVAVWFSATVQLVSPIPDPARSMAPPKEVAELLAKRQFIRLMLELSLDRAPPMDDEFPRNMQLIRMDWDWLNSATAPPSLAAEFPEKVQCVMNGAEPESRMAAPSYLVWFATKTQLLMVGEQ